jgi:lysophospholipase L1-like esterase
VEKGKSIAFRIVALVMPLVILAIGFEVVLRIVGYDPLAPSRRGERRSAVLFRETEDPDLEYEPVPGASGEAFRSYVKINSAGFRDDEYTVGKPEGTYRIVALGDSITFGMKFPIEDRFTEQLERRLQSEGRKVEVLNLGVAGYDTIQEVAFLEKTGLRFEPDLVVVAFCINDAGVHTMNRSYIRRLRSYDSPIYRSRVVQFLAVRRDRLDQARYFESANREERFRQRFAGRIADLAGDAELAELRLRLRDYLDEHSIVTRRGFLEWYALEDHIGRLRYAFEALSKLSLEHGFDVVVTIVPYLAEGNHAAAYDLAYAIVRHEAERNGFDVVGIQDEFREVGLARVANPDSKLHPNPLGHRIIADRLYDYLTREGGIE